MKKCLIWMAVILMLTVVFAQAETATVPELSITRRPIPDTEAMAFMKKLGAGWNLGNTFDAYNDGLVRDELSIESYWCGVKTKPEFFATLREAGFTTVRMPVSWHNHVSGDDFVISKAWLDRVQEVVDMALNEGFYVILNTHHDVDKKYYYPSEAYYASSEKYLTSVWRQVAERFKDYDEHLILESLNEPRLKDTKYEWSFSSGAKECMEAADIINRLNQAFVTTVRESGGQNASRYLAVPGYSANVYNTTAAYFKLPEDTVENRLIVSVHAYTPYNFALDANGVKRFDFSLTQKGEIAGFMNTLYDKFIVNGIPVMLDEYGARGKDNLQDRVNFAAFYVATASARNIVCCWWDNNVFSGTGERFGLLNRHTGKIEYPELAEAIVRYTGYDKLPDPEN